MPSVSLLTIPKSAVSDPSPSSPPDWLSKKLSSLLNARFSHCSLRAFTLEKVLLPVPRNHIILVSSYVYISLSFQILQHGHHLLPTLWMMFLQLGLELLGQDGEELLQHQQLQNLLLGMCLWPKPLMAELQETAQCFLGTRGILVAEVSKLLPEDLPGRRLVLWKAETLIPEVVFLQLHFHHHRPLLTPWGLEQLASRLSCVHGHHSWLLLEFQLEASEGTLGNKN